MAATTQMREHFTGMRYGDLKKQVAEMVISQLEPFQKRYNEIIAEQGYLDAILKKGCERVSPIANSTVELVKQRMGLYTAASGGMPSPSHSPATCACSGATGISGCCGWRRSSAKSATGFTR